MESSQNAPQEERGKKKMPTLTDPRLQAAMKKRREALEVLEQNDERLVDLLLPKELERDKEFARLEKQKLDLHKKRHRTRINIGRKKFSLDCIRKRVKRIEGEIKSCHDVEQKLGDQIKELESQQEKAKQRVSEQLRSSVKKQALP